MKKVITIPAGRKATVVIEGDAAYAIAYPETTTQQTRDIHVELGKHGFELMEPEESPPEVQPDGGVKMWAARVGG